MNPTPRLRLFIDAHSFDKEHQGTRAFIKRSYLAFHKIAPEVELYFGAQNIEHLKHEFSGIPNCKFVRYVSRFTLIRLFIEVPFAIYKHKIHAAHFQYIVPIIKNCKFIVTTHDLVFKEFPGEFTPFYRMSRSALFKLSIKMSDIVTTVSEYSKSSIKKHFGFSEKHFLVLPNSTNNDYRDLHVSKADALQYLKKYQLTKYILYVSRFEPRKNHVTLLKAFHELGLVEQGYQLVLLGHQSMAIPEFEAYYQQLSAQEKRAVLVSDSANDRELYYFYRGAALFVYPSKAEGFGLPPIEAASLGVPVICSNQTAMSEYRFFGNNHIDPTNLNVLKERIAEVLKLPPTSEDLSAITNEVHTRYNATLAAERLYGAIRAAFPDLY